MNLLENVLPKLKLQNPPTDPTERVHKIPVCRILPNPAQPRKYFDSDETLRLADSIRRSASCNRSACASRSRSATSTTTAASMS